MIIRNAIQTPDGTILESTHQHDFKLYKDTVTNKEYGVDGGLAYLRYIGDIEDCTLLSLDTCHVISHEDVRTHFKWGTYGPDGTSPLTYVLLKDLSDDHIKAILRTQTLSYEVSAIFTMELIHRVQLPNRSEDSNVPSFKPQRISKAPTETN